MINVVQKIDEKQINAKKDKIAMVPILCNTQFYVKRNFM